MATLCVNNFVWEGERTSSGWFKGYHQNRVAWLSENEEFMIVQGLAADGCSYWVYEAQTGRIFAWTANLKSASDAVKLHRRGFEFLNPINLDPLIPAEPDSNPDWRFFK